MRREASASRLDIDGHGLFLRDETHIQLALAVRVLAHFPAFDLHALDGVLQFLRFHVDVPFG